MNSFDLVSLWNRRFQSFSRDVIHYFSKIGNSGFLFALILLSIVGAIYYRRFLEWLPEAAPIPLMLAILFSILITVGNLRTFLKEADLSYLTPLELRMKNFFRRSFMYNVVVQSAGIFAVAIIVNPLYMGRVAAEAISFPVFVLLLIVMKVFNLYSRWYELRLHHRRERIIQGFMRWILNVLFIYGLLQWNLRVLSLIAAISLVIRTLLFVSKTMRHSGIHWLKLLHMEEKLDGRFYRTVNFFVDVPQLQNKAVHRRIIPALTGYLPFRKSYAYHYLLFKLWSRSGYMFGMFIRWTLVGMILIFLIPDIYGEGFAYLLFLVISGMQWRAFWGEFYRRVSFQLYPLPEDQQKQAFVSISFAISMIQAMMVTIPHFFHDHTPVELFALPITGIIITYIYGKVMIQGYITKKLEEEGALHG